MPIQKKKQSRFARLGAKLKTPKGRLLATILIFAFIGGGILVYRSFAATRTWGYNLAMGNLTSEKSSSTSSCTNSHTYDAQYKTNVVSLYCPYNGNGQVSAKTIGSYLPQEFAGRNYRFCAYVKGTGRFKTSLIFTQVAGLGGHNQSITTHAASATYSYYCSEYKKLPYASQLVGRVIVEVDGGLKWVNVGGIVLEMQ